MTVAEKSAEQRLSRSRRQPSGKDSRGAGRFARRGMMYLVVSILALFCVVPFAWVLLASIDSHAGLYLHAPDVTMNNFVRFFQQPTTPRLLFNSFVLAGGGTAVAMALAMLGGYALSRYKFFGRRTLMFAILLVRVVPPTATIVPLYIMMINLNLNNTYIGVIIVEAAYQIPFLLWLMKGFYDSIPFELEEAAWIDGCSRFSGVRHIVFPLSRPGIGAGTLFAFINVWGDFLTPLVLLQSPEKYPISIGLFQAFSAFNQVDWGLLTATAVLYMVPTVLLYLFVRKYLLRATVSGALKG